MPRRYMAYSLSCAQGSPLVRLREPYGGLGIELRFDACRANALPPPHVTLSPTPFYICIFLSKNFKPGSDQLPFTKTLNWKVQSHEQKSDVAVGKQHVQAVTCSASQGAYAAAVPTGCPALCLVLWPLSIDLLQSTVLQWILNQMKPNIVVSFQFIAALESSWLCYLWWNLFLWSEEGQIFRGFSKWEILLFT